MTDDAELLRRYVEQRSEAAFAQLVSQHVDMVYSAAFRQMRGDHHRAQEVTQMVFTDLARKAAGLLQHPVLPAWLHRSSRLAALALSRKEARRQGYENAAGKEALIAEPNTPALDWGLVGPVLDDAISELEIRDREAILLRYFSAHPFGEIGRKLKLSENAARMRVERALIKLHERLSRRGISSTSAALAAALAAQSVVAAPIGVAAAASSAALTASVGVAGWVSFMTSSKLSLALAAAVVVGGAALIGSEEKAQTEAASRIAILSRQNALIPALRQQNQKLAVSSVHTRQLMDEASNLEELEKDVEQLETQKTNNSAEQTILQRHLAVRNARLDPSAAAFDISRLDQRPKILKQGRPTYPQEMAYSGEQGEVLVDFIVGTDGQVYNAVALQSSNREFEYPAMQAVNQWQFSPGQVGGLNVNVHMQVPIVFSLNAGTPPPAIGTWF
jgi:RNA polymerase sigma factor (sigma-70 family)